MNEIYTGFDGLFYPVMTIAQWHAFAVLCNQTVSSSNSETKPVAQPSPDDEKAETPEEVVTTETELQLVLNIVFSGLCLLILKQLYF